VFVVLAHERRRILHFAVTAHPTAEGTAQQMREAFPWDTAPRYLLRDRDRIFGQDFVRQVKAMGIKQVLSAPRSPWQRAYMIIVHQCPEVPVQASLVEHARCAHLIQSSGWLTFVHNHAKVIVACDFFVVL